MERWGLVRWGGHAPIPPRRAADSQAPSPARRGAALPPGADRGQERRAPNHPRAHRRAGRGGPGGAQRGREPECDFRTAANTCRTVWDARPRDTDLVHGVGEGVSEGSWAHLPPGYPTPTLPVPAALRGAPGVSPGERWPWVCGESALGAGPEAQRPSRPHVALSTRNVAVQDEMYPGPSTRWLPKASCDRD